ncbi:MAG: 3'-5' exonuclease [Bacteroidetes bacterium]|nr:3'-5' exonuclease [Bacteroidota bacterium]
MLENINISNILFLDIETVPQHSKFDEAPKAIQHLWEKKAKFLIKDETETPDTIYRQAGIYAEFGKVVCISCGYFSSENKLRIKSFAGDDEKLVLSEFAEMLKKFFSRNDKQLCAHNGKEFDFPFLARRMVINGIPLPAVLDTPGKKPWEVNHLDTLELWKFGDYKSYTSLLLLATVLGIPTPKDDIDGSMVWDVYWNENNLQRIVTYCQKDVLTIAQIFLRFKGEALLSENDLEIVGRAMVS